MDNANKVEYALTLCKRVMEQACEIGDSDWNVYVGFKEALKAIEAAQQSFQADSAICPECGAENKVFVQCSSCFHMYEPPNR